MLLRTYNEFDNYLNAMTFQIEMLTGVTDPDMLADFKLYFKDYVIGEIFSGKEYIDISGLYRIPVGVKVALAASGISYGTVPGNQVKVEGFYNSDFLQQLAQEEAKKIDVEVGGDGYDYFPSKIEFFLRRAKYGSYQEVVSDLINYELGLEDRLVGYIPTSKEDMDKTEDMAGSLHALSIEVRKLMNKEGLNQSNSITYEIVNLVFEDCRHYSLAEKKALIGMVYVDTLIQSGEEVANDILGQTIVAVEAASYINDKIAALKSKFNRRIRDHYGYAKIIDFPGRWKYEQ